MAYRRTSGLGISSLILGVLSLILGGPFTAIPGVITGHMARTRIRNFPERYAEAGNSIFAAVEGGEVVGVCALKRDADGGWELTKMAVDREVRGRGIGRELMDVVEGYARDELGVERIYLISNTVHAAAIRLYRRSGWVVTFEGPHPRYARANIGMEKGF